MPIASIKSGTRVKDLRQIGCVKGELEATFWLFRFLVRASRDLWAFLLGEGRFPRHSHLSPEDPTFYIGVGYAVPTVTGHEWERSAQTLRD